MAKSKVESAKNVQFAKGGTTKMFPQQAAESETVNGSVGHTADPTGSDANVHSTAGAAGGKTKMFGYNPSQTARAGITSAR